MLVADTLPGLPELTADQVELWIAAALAEAKALRQHDEHVYPRDNEPMAMQVAKKLHAAWARWADQAEALLARARSLKGSSHVPGLHDLEYATLRARAMLKISPEVMLARQEQVRRGEVLTAEEVRRELRLANRR
jgi:hypothetical protein